MLLIRSFFKKTPKIRLQVKHKFTNNYYSKGEVFTKYVSNNSKVYLGKRTVRSLKFLCKKELKRVSYSFTFNLPMFISNIVNFKTKLVEYSLIKNMYGITTTIPQTSSYIPGFKLYPFSTLKHMANIKKLVGQCIPLIFIPINMFISFLYNIKNNRGTYIRSSGSKGSRKKLNRREKLINVLLPSNTIKIFPITTLGVFSNTVNLYTNKIVEGGWSYFPKNKKHINVRGVAKNPVDHPNGGRTKAKQPELSPWGWIAKQNKKW